MLVKDTAHSQLPQTIQKRHEDPNFFPIYQEKDDGEDEELSLGSAEAAPLKRKKKRDKKAPMIKNPNAPKRFKSSYICFFVAQQPHIKQELGEHASVSEVSKRSAELWRTLPAHQRVQWDEVAAKDKQRYLIEKAQYTGPWQVRKKKTRKDPSAPKRPMSAFLHFSQGRRQSIKKQNPDIQNTEVSKMLGDLWRNATSKEKEPFILKEKEERDKYKVAIDAWHRDMDRKKEQQRRLLEAQMAQQFSQQAPSYQDLDQNGQPVPLHYYHDDGQPMPASHHHYAQHPHPVAPAPPYYPFGNNPPNNSYPPYMLAPNGMPHSVVPPKGPVILGPNGVPRYLAAERQPGPQMPPMQMPQHREQDQTYMPAPVDYNESHDQGNSQSFDMMVERISEPQGAD